MKFWLFPLFLLTASSCIDIYQWGRDNPCDPDYHGSEPCTTDSGNPGDISLDAEDSEGGTDISADSDIPEIEDIPVCPEICIPETAKCSDWVQISVCEKGPDQCWKWLDAGTCGLDEFDAQNSCNQSVDSGTIETVCCQNECPWSRFECLSGETFQKCSLTPDNCYEWSPGDCADPFDCQSRISMCVRDEFRVNSYTDYDQATAKTVQLDTYRYAVTWVSRNQDGNMNGVIAKVFNSLGDPVSSELVVNDYTTTEQQNVYISALGQNRFVVIWDSMGQEGINNVGVFGRILDSQGQRLFSEFQVNTFTTNSQSVWELQTIDPDRFVVSWTSFLNGFVNLYLKVYTGNGTPVPSSEVRLNSSTSATHQYPQIQILNGNRIVVVWETTMSGPTSYQLFARIFNSSGGEIVAPFTVNPNASAYSSNFRTAKLDEFRFVVVWHFYAAYTYGIYGKIFSSAGEGISTLFQVNAEVMNQGWPEACVIDNTRFVVVWIADQPGGPSVNGRLFETAGTPLSSGQFLISHETALYTYRTPPVIPLNNHRFAVLWSNESKILFLNLLDREGTPLNSSFPVNTQTIDVGVSYLSSIGSSRFVVTWREKRNSNLDIWARIFYQ